MRSAILATLLLSTAMMTPLTIAARAEDVEVVAKQLDRVESPRELQNLWTDVRNTPAETTIKKLVTEIYKTCVGCETFAVNFTDARLIHLRDSGEEHVGAIQSPPGYTVCRAFVISPSVNCNGTFTGSYRKADDPASGNIDGLHYYIVVPKPGLFAGRCWVEGTIVVTFIKPQSDNPLSQKCAKSGEIAFHYGK